ncbi:MULTISPECIES: hypothetical protein [unclassified Mycolicibacterium]|uniref:hypothetical protein n=1 Tax=unclassified Mycolicibacterium TaxID=2636767 RepID=UPI001EE3EB41|nr:MULTISPECIES: hypothetical protein [unclassified Mycolicibacterium]
MADHRRWPNKAQLVGATLDAVTANGAEPLTRVTAELATLMRHDEQLAQAMREHLDTDELSPFHDVAEALILRQVHLDLPVGAISRRPEVIRDQLHRAGG